MTTHAYVARCRNCGRIVEAIADDADNRLQIAQLVGRWLRRGHQVDRLFTSHAQEVDQWGCVCEGRAVRAKFLNAQHPTQPYSPPHVSRVAWSFTDNPVVALDTAEEADD